MKKMREISFFEKWWEDFCEKYKGEGLEMCIGYRGDNGEPTIALTYNGQTLEEANAKIEGFKGFLFRMDGSVNHTEDEREEDEEE